MDSFGLSPLMHSVVNKSGGRTWLSNAPVCQRDFSDIVDHLAEKGQVVIVSGTHGQESGKFDPALRERSFYLEDVTRWKGNPNVTVLGAFELTDTQLTSALNQQNSIAAWCYSDHDERVIRSLGCCKK